VAIAEVVANGYNLDLRTLNGSDDVAHRPPAELIVIDAEREILGLLEKLEVELGPRR
jgi:type I restriction enzyme M protein